MGTVLILPSGPQWSSLGTGLTEPPLQGRCPHWPTVILGWPWGLVPHSQDGALLIGCSGTVIGLCLLRRGCLLLSSASTQTGVAAVRSPGGRL